MAQIPYRANLSSAIFPMTIAKGGRTVINPQYDHNFDKRVDSPGDHSKGSVGIPQALYMQNVLPTPDGFQSIKLITKDPITFPGGSAITATTKIRVATIQTGIETSEDVDITDTGDTIENWSRSVFWDEAPTTIGNLGDTGRYTAADHILYSENGESSSIGDPVNSYRLAHLELYDGTVSPPHLLHPSYLIRNVGISTATSIQFNWRIRFVKGEIFNTVSMLLESFTGTKHMNVPVGNNSIGSGIRIVFTSVTGRLSICTCPGGTQSTADGTVGPWDSRNLSIITSVPLTIAYDTWYRFECQVIRNSDGSQDITVVAKDNVGATILTLTGSVDASITRGDYVGFIHANATYDNFTYGGFDLSTGGPYDIAPDKVYYDQITIFGSIPDVSVQINSGIENRYLSWINDSDDIVKVSESLLFYDNTVVTESGTLVAPSNDSEVSTALVRGRCFICIHTSGTTHIYEYTEPSGTPTITNIDATIDAGLLDGYTIDDVVSIIGSFNYLILITNARVFWSSTTTPTDFAESLISGAGSDIPGNLSGDIVFGKEHVAGFYLYTKGNVVFAQYTGNARYPWKFREVAGSGGYVRSTQVSGDINTSSQIGITTSKLIQELGIDSASLLAPEVTDYLERGNYYDDFNSITNVFTITYSEGLGLNSSLGLVSVWFVLDRYIIVPYARDESGDASIPFFRFAIVYDLQLKRYGKIKLNFSNVLTDDQFIYFIDYVTGNIYQLSFNLYSGSTAILSCILFGKFQFSRNNMIQLEEIEVESSQSEVLFEDTPQFAVRIYPSLDGKTFETSVVPTEIVASTEFLRRYVTHKVAKNFCILISQVFDISTLGLQFVQHGRY